jgi:hypothetical protein
VRGFCRSPSSAPLRHAHGKRRAIPGRANEERPRPYCPHYRTGTSGDRSAAV